MTADVTGKLTLSQDLADHIAPAVERTEDYAKIGSNEIASGSINRLFRDEI